MISGIHETDDDNGFRCPTNEQTAVVAETSRLHKPQVCGVEPAEARDALTPNQLASVAAYCTLPVEGIQRPFAPEFRSPDRPAYNDVMTAPAMVAAGV